jgi:hypothetical protein
MESFAVGHGLDESSGKKYFVDALFNDHSELQYNTNYSYIVKLALNDGTYSSLTYLQRFVAFKCINNNRLDVV